MCGIVGAIGIEIDDSLFAGMLSTLRHRGPDSESMASPALGRRIGHTRLTIMDVSNAGRQPFHDEATGVWAVVNGEIYNYPDLRAELEKKGHVFRSHSDSEVVLRGYIAWGDEMVARLRGIFAFAVYDQTNDRLLLARDAAGVKPLFYEHSTGGILFASELKALLAARNRAYDIEPMAIWAYLAYRYVPGELTPYKSVFKLPPAHMLVWERGVFKVTRWWAPRARSDYGIAKLCETIRESVRAQLMSDVPVGVMLSGGIDSSAVTAFATDNGNIIDAFCCGFTENGYDERPFARMAADACGARLHEIVMDQETLISLLPDYIDWFDEPFFDYSAIAVHRLCKLARDRDIKVLLAGDGADELFAGYLWYDDFAQQKRGNQDEMLERFFSYKGYFSRRMLSIFAGRPVDFDHLSVLRSFDRPDLPPVNRGQWLDFHTFLPDDILAKVDRASMALGVEVRVPLLDQRLLDECFLWPEEILYHGGERKHAFKRALAGVLPGYILTARKKGFGFPLNSWNKPIRYLARAVLNGGQLEMQGYACTKGIDNALVSLNIHFIWLLLTAELWFRRFVGHDDIHDLVEKYCREGIKG